MHLIYFDESGNTGNNLNDHQQPIFVLCALAVPEDRWLQVELGQLRQLPNLGRQFGQSHTVKIQCGRTGLGNFFDAFECFRSWFLGLGHAESSLNPYTNDKQ